jgi:hypothetical protein
MADTPNAGAPAPEASNTPALEASDQAVDQVEEAVAGAEGGDPAATAVKAETEKQLKAEIKKWKLKIDGKEEELDEESLVKHAQMGKAAQKRMQEAAELRKNVEAFLTVLKADPLKVLSDPSLGIDPEARKRMAEAIINNEIEEMQKSPEQREKEKLQRELEELKNKHKQDEESRKAREFQRLQDEASKQLDRDMTQALETSGLPKSPYTVKKLAEVMMIALQNNVEISAADAIPLIRKQMQAEIKEMFASTPEDLIEEFIGKDNISRLRKRNLQRMKQSADSPSAVKSTGSEVKKNTEAPKKIAMKDFLKGNW